MVDFQTTPLARIADEMERAIHNDAAYAALSLALTLPEICSHLAAKDPERAGRSYELYRDWFDRNVSPHVPLLTGHDCYYLRCGVSHFANSGHSKMAKFKKIIFTLPFDGNVNQNATEDILQLDLTRFCAAMKTAVEQWVSRIPATSHTARHLEDMLQYGDLRFPGLEFFYPPQALQTK